MWDHTEDEQQRWHGCPNHKPGRGSEAKTAGNDCLFMGNRFSASLIWRAHHPVFGGGGGFIFRPPFIRIACSYGADAGTRGGDSDGCGHDWCDPPAGSDGWCSGRPYRPERLVDMLRGWTSNGRTYNELIVDVGFHDVHLPHSVEAILYDNWVHKNFIEHFRSRGHDLTEADVPLVSFDPADEHAPFKAIPNDLLPEEARAW